MKRFRAAVLIVLVAGLSACDNATEAAPAPAQPAATQPAATQPATTQPAAAEPTATKTKPAATRPATKKPTGETGVKPAGPCPATVAELQKASDLSNSHRIDPDRIRCARRWATAGVLALDPAVQGDGVILFEHRNGGWRRITEGSSLTCDDYGIPEEIGDQVGCHH